MFSRVESATFSLAALEEDGSAKKREHLKTHISNHLFRQERDCSIGLPSFGKDIRAAFLAFDGACGRDKARQFYEGTNITSTPKDSIGFSLAAFEEGSFAIMGIFKETNLKSIFASICSDSKLNYRHSAKPPEQTFWLLREPTI